VPSQVELCAQARWDAL